ncbi:uncharacterized protein LOC122173365 [Chrysemys picta bellii]|uniref:uncharacterized protein LOC122173365 n=1 Tax=Chrysemys picta bellii TaxID=8478 RepID=UPI0032B242FC
MPFSPAGSQPQIFTEPSSQALLGSGVLLKCRFDVGGPIDLSSLRVQWHFWDQRIAVYNWGKGDSQVPRASLSEQELQRGNASLSLSNVTLADGGLYKCLIENGGEELQGETTLHVLAAPRIIVPQRLGIIFRETSFPCHVWGFYPRDIAVTWLRDGRVRPESTYSPLQRNLDGTFNLTLTYTFTPMDWDKGSILTCRVSHASLVQPLQEEFALIITLRPVDTGLIVSGVLVGVIVICCLIYSVYCWKRLKKGMGAPYSISEVLGPVWCRLGQEMTLSYAMGGKFPKDTAVTWERIHGQDRTVIGTDGVSEAGEGPEHQLLLHPQPQRWRATQERSGTCLTASLSFTPTVQDDGARVRCSFHHEARGIREQRESGEIRPWACPEVSQIQVLPQWEPQDMVPFAVQIQNFYPKGIHWIQWHWDGAESWRDESPEITQNPDLTFSATSVCRIPSQKFNNPELRVRVLVQQTRRDPPVWREIRARDTGRKLCYRISDVRGLEGCLLGQEVTLSCAMEGTFPEDTAVTWERIHGEDMMVIVTDGVSEAGEGPENHPLLHPHLQCWRVAQLQSENVLVSFLTFTPTVQDDGARVRCSFHHEARGIREQQVSDIIRVSGGITNKACVAN